MREHGGQASVQARREEECVHDVGLELTQMPLNPDQTPGPSDARIQTEHAKGHARVPDFLANGPGLIDTRHAGLETVRKMPNQVEHHFFRAANHERVRQVQYARAARAHDDTCV